MDDQAEATEWARAYSKEEGYVWWRKGSDGRTFTVSGREDGSAVYEIRNRVTGQRQIGAASTLDAAKRRCDELTESSKY